MNALGSLSMRAVTLDIVRPAGLAHARGDFGETPGVVYGQHLEPVIGQGAPPTSLLRRTLLG